MGIITPASLDFNTLSSRSSVVGELTTVRLRPKTFTHVQILTIAEQLCRESGYKLHTTEKVVRTLIKLANSNYQLFDSRKCIALESGCSQKTVKNVLSALELNGQILDSRRGTWLDRQTNVISLLFLKTKLPDVTVKSSDDLRTLKQDLNTNYKKPVSKVCRLKKKEPDKPPKGESRFVNAEALQTNQDAEVKRIALAHSLTAKQSEYALKRMRAHGITNAARFLATMAKGLSLGTWNTDDIEEEKPIISPAEKLQQAEQIDKQAEQLAIEQLTRMGIDLVQAQTTGDWVQCKMHHVRQLNAEAKKLRETIN